jgi:hypothetical protein
VILNLRIFAEDESTPAGKPQSHRVMTTFRSIPCGRNVAGGDPVGPVGEHRSVRGVPIACIVPVIAPSLVDNVWRDDYPKSGGNRFARRSPTPTVTLLSGDP